MLYFTDLIFCFQGVEKGCIGNEWVNLKNTKSTWLTSYSEAYSEPSLISKMELFAKIVKGFQPLSIFAKNSILDVPLGSE